MREELVRMESAKKEKIMTLTNPFVEWGQEEGRLQEGANLLLRQLRRRFGEVGEERERMIRGLTLEKLEELGEALLEFGSWEDLSVWLSRHA